MHNSIAQHQHIIYELYLLIEHHQLNLVVRSNIKSYPLHAELGIMAFSYAI